MHRPCRDAGKEINVSQRRCLICLETLLTAAVGRIWSMLLAAEFAAMAVGIPAAAIPLLGPVNWQGYG